MSTKDYMEKDYYKTLGVSKDAKPDEIKKAFRKLARDNHPDQHPGDAAAEKRFKEVSEAYSILSDPKKRKEYDETRSLFGGGFPFGRPGGQRHGAQPGGFDDLFRGAQGGGAGQNLGDIFGGLFGGGAATRRPFPFARSQNFQSHRELPMNNTRTSGLPHLADLLELTARTFDAVFENLDGKLAIFQRLARDPALHAQLVAHRERLTRVLQAGFGALQHAKPKHRQDFDDILAFVASA